MKPLGIGVLALFILTGCAFGGFSRNKMHETPPTVTSGTSIEQVVGTYGPPDKYIKIGTKEYLAYKTKSGWYVLLFGSTTAKDVEMKFEDGKFVDQKVMDAGSSFGIIGAQGAIGN
jgi:hypothetical protein